MYVLFIASLLKTSVKRAGLKVGEGGGWGAGVLKYLTEAVMQMCFWEMVGLLTGTQGNKVKTHHFENWLMVILPSLIGFDGGNRRN